MTIHDDEPEHQKAEDARRVRTRRASILGLLAWGALVALLILRGANVITSDAWVTAGGIWLIGGGCLGSPIPALRLAPLISLILGCSVGLCAAFLAGLILAGRMQPDTLTAYSLVSLVAFSIHAINGSGASMKERGQRQQIEQQQRRIAFLEEYLAEHGKREREKGRAEGRIEGLEIARDEQLRRIEALESVKSVPLETVENWYLTVAREIGMIKGGKGRHLLRLVASTGGADQGAMDSTQELFLRRGYRAPREIGASAHRATRPTGTSRRGPGT